MSGKGGSNGVQPAPRQRGQSVRKAPTVVMPYLLIPAVAHVCDWCAPVCRAAMHCNYLFVIFFVRVRIKSMINDVNHADD